MAEFTPHSASSYFVEGYTSQPNAAEKAAIIARVGAALEKSPVEFWLPRNSQDANSLGGEIAVTPLPDPLENFFLSTQGYDGKQVFIELKERYRVAAPFGNSSYSKERVVRKLGEMIAGVPVEKWRLGTVLPVIQAHINAFAAEEFERVVKTPEDAIQIAEKISIFAKSVRPESIKLLQHVLSTVGNNDSLSPEAKVNLRERTHELFVLYSFGRAESFPVGEKWQHMKGSRSVLLYQYNAVDLSDAAKEALSFEELVA